MMMMMMMLEKKIYVLNQLMLNKLNNKCSFICLNMHNIR